MVGLLALSAVCGRDQLVFSDLRARTLALTQMRELLAARCSCDSSRCRCGSSWKRVGFASSACPRLELDVLCPQHAVISTWVAGQPISSCLRRVKFQIPRLLCCVPFKNGFLQDRLPAWGGARFAPRQLSLAQDVVLGALGCDQPCIGLCYRSQAPLVSGCFLILPRLVRTPSATTAPRGAGRIT